jgi:NAD(P)-dependent dehydrogenase (short-subunit alcohol dehydrogenase family)
MRLQDKVVVITGGGAGLGRECALLFAEHGARLVVSDVDEQRARNAAKAVTEAGGTAVGVRADVTDEDDVRALMDATVETYGRLDVTLANAGIPVPGFGTVPLEETSLESWHRVIDVNLTGVFLCTKHSVAPMRATGGGAIVVTSSAGGLRAYPGFASYCASKGGVNMFVRGAATDLGRYGIRVNAICPAWGMSANFALGPADDVVGLSYEEAEVAGGAAWDPETFPGPLKLGRPPSLRDNAFGALYLASDESAYMSGVFFATTDGGSTSRIYANPMIP